MTTTAFRNPIYVDSCGANPYDGLPDSAAIQQCINGASSGDTILFTSPGKTGYKGYLIDKTIFLEMTSPVRQNLVFASTDPGRPALLNATNDLKGFVIQLYARSHVSAGVIDNITLSNLQVDGGRDRRVGLGPDGVADGVDDNWGSWLPECTQTGDPWCNPGGVYMYGATDTTDPTQNYKANPDLWSTGLVVKDMVIQNVESGSALIFGGAGGTVENNVISGSGDHAYASGCNGQDGGKDFQEWADGITLFGPGNVVSGNIVRDASDVGIVFFGGKNTIISGNEVVADPGNNGMFAGIAVHAWIWGDVSGVQVVNNRVENDGSSACGGIETGINIGPQMWGAGCVQAAASGLTVGNAGSCTNNPSQPMGALCTAGKPCQVWAYVEAGFSLTLTGNFVRGAQVNYLVDGLDLVGTLVANNNVSESPRTTEWQAASQGCNQFGITNTWGTYDFVAHNPSLPGWMDVRIYCER